MTTVRTIAKKTGVSIATVSRVLNNQDGVSDEVRQRVVNAVNSDRYVSSVGRRSTTNVAMLYTGDASLNSPFDNAVLEGLTRGMQDSNLDLMVLETRRLRRKGETYSQALIRKGVRGVVVRTTTNTRSVCEAIAHENFPAVVVGDRFDDDRVCSVYSDSRAASRDVVEYLIGLGHRRIALCSNIVVDSDHEDRMMGYRDAMARHGLPVEEELVTHMPATRLGGAQLMRRFMTLPNRPTAVYITDPMAAVGALAEVQNMGFSVPRDVSVAGFDDSELRFMMYPTLTAVCQDAVALGHEAFNLLKQLLAGQHEAGMSRALRTWMEVGHSTGPAPDA